MALRSAHLVLSSFGYSTAAGGWRVEHHPRFVEDVTGDGKADIIGFGYYGVEVSVSNGNGTFQPRQLGIDEFGYSDAAGGWRVQQHPRFVEDVTGDGEADIIGFGYYGVEVSVSNGDGTFQPRRLGIDEFGYSDDAGGWRVQQHPRFVEDVTGDGKADIIGFGYYGVEVSVSNGDGTFQQRRLGIDEFGYSDDAGGWRVQQHPRFVEDVTGDGEADIIGFGYYGVEVSVSNGNGTFQPRRLGIDEFGYSDSAGGWRVQQHPRFVEDVTGDGRADIIGFGHFGVEVSVSNGNGTFQPRRLVSDEYGNGDVAGAWRVQQHPRLVEDVTGDGRADIIGFGHQGVYVSEWIG